MCCVDRLKPHLKADIRILPGNVECTTANGQEPTFYFGRFERSCQSPGRAFYVQVVRMGS